RHPAARLRSRRRAAARPGRAHRAPRARPPRRLRRDGRRRAWALGAGAPSRQRQREPVVRVGVPGDQLEAAGVEVVADALARELPGDFGAELLAGGEARAQADAGELDVVGVAGAQSHLDPLVLGVEAGDVVEGARIEVGTELAVDDVEDVAVELGGDAGGVVV